MLLILSDLPQSTFERVPFPCGCRYIHAPEAAKGCGGCFACWFEHPGACIKQDGVSGFSSLMGKCERFIIISKNTYGSYSPAIKNVLERSISYVRPSFKLKKGEMHHKKRYKKPFSLDAVFYGETDGSFRDAARRLTSANAVNMHASSCKAHFINDFCDLGAIL